MQDQLIYSWYEQYKVGLFRFALSILKDTHMAEDALQEAFVRLLRQNRLPDPEKVQAWLYRVVRNICYDTLRKRRREVEASPIATPEKNWEFSDLIASLPQKEQEILALRFIGGFSHKDIAVITGMTVHSVKKRYERAIAKLRTEMEVSI